MAKTNKSFRGKITYGPNQPKQLPLPEPKKEERNKSETPLEEMVQDCNLNQKYEKKDLNGKQYCTLIFPGDMKGHCTYLGKITDYSFKTEKGYTYNLCFYGCNKK
mgnify:FL=1